MTQVMYAFVVLAVIFTIYVGTDLHYNNRSISTAASQQEGSWFHYGSFFVESAHSLYVFMAFFFLYVYFIHSLFLFNAI